MAVSRRRKLPWPKQGRGYRVRWALIVSAIASLAVLQSVPRCNGQATIVLTMDHGKEDDKAFQDKVHAREEKKEAEEQERQREKEKKQREKEAGSAAAAGAGANGSTEGGLQLQQEQQRTQEEEVVEEKGEEHELEGEEGEGGLNPFDEAGGDSPNGLTDATAAAVAAAAADARLGVRAQSGEGEGGGGELDTPPFGSVPGGEGQLPKGSGGEGGLRPIEEASMPAKPDMSVVSRPAAVDGMGEEGGLLGGGGGGEGGGEVGGRGGGGGGGVEAGGLRLPGYADGVAGAGVESQGVRPVGVPGGEGRVFEEKMRLRDDESSRSDNGGFNGGVNGGVQRMEGEGAEGREGSSPQGPSGDERERGRAGAGEGASTTHAAAGGGGARKEGTGEEQVGSEVLALRELERHLNNLETVRRRIDTSLLELLTSRPRVPGQGLGVGVGVGGGNEEEGKGPQVEEEGWCRDMAAGAKEAHWGLVRMGLELNETRRNDFQALTLELKTRAEVDREELVLERLEDGKIKVDYETGKLKEKGKEGGGLIQGVPSKMTSFIDEELRDSLEELLVEADPAVLHLDEQLLRDIVALSMITAVGGAFAAMMRVPYSLGYLLAGIIAGPSCFDLITRVSEAQTIAQFGSIFLLFGHGLAYSTHAHRRLPTHSAGAGAAGAGVTAASGATGAGMAVAAAAAAAGGGGGGGGGGGMGSHMGMALAEGGVGTASGRVGAVTVLFVCFSALTVCLSLAGMHEAGEIIYIAAATTVSSTTIVSDFLGRTGLTDTVFAWMVMDLVYVQDVIMCPLLAVPTAVLRVYLEAESGWADCLLRLLAGACALLGCWMGCKLMLPHAVKLIRPHQAEDRTGLFTLGVVSYCLGMSIIFESLSLSCEAGALFAGMVMMDSPFAAVAQRHIYPLTNFFGGIYMASLGMIMSPTYLVNHFPLVARCVVLVLLLKLVVVVAVMRSFGFSVRAGALAGGLMAQIGEISLFFIARAHQLGLVSRLLYLIMVATTIVLLAISPLTIALLERFPMSPSETTSSTAGGDTAARRDLMLKRARPSSDRSRSRSPSPIISGGIGLRDGIKGGGAGGGPGSGSGSGSAVGGSGGATRPSAGAGEEHVDVESASSSSSLLQRGGRGALDSSDAADASGEMSPRPSSSFRHRIFGKKQHL